MKTLMAILRIALAVSLVASMPGHAGARDDFARRVAGTYLLDEGTEFRRLLTLTIDGNVIGTDSSEPIGEPFFGGQQGVWRRVGAKSIAATVVNFRFLRTESEVVQAGSALADYRLSFLNGFEETIGTITLKVFGAGVDPLDPSATPEEPEITFEFRGRRVPLPDPG